MFASIALQFLSLSCFALTAYLVIAFRRDPKFRQDLGASVGGVKFLFVSVEGGGFGVALVALLGFCALFQYIDQASAIRRADQNAAELDKQVKQLAQATPAVGERLELRVPDILNPPPCDGGGPRPSPVPVSLSAPGFAGLANLALLKTASVTASSTYDLPQRHQKDFLIDGWYGNCRSWVAGAPTARLDLDLGRDFEIKWLRLGNEHSGAFTDRGVTKFTVYMAKANSDEWKEVLSYNEPTSPIRATRDFKVDAAASRIRIDILSTEDGHEPRFDEIEVYGKVPSPEFTGSN